MPLLLSQLLVLRTAAADAQTRRTILLLLLLLLPVCLLGGGMKSFVEVLGESESQCIAVWKVGRVNLLPVDRSEAQGGAAIEAKGTTAT